MVYTQASTYLQQWMYEYHISIVTVTVTHIGICWHLDSLSKFHLNYV
jgi:hypothetical protein